MTKILIIGNTSETYHMGSIFLRAGKSLSIECIECDINPQKYAPSMTSLWGRVFFKLSAKRPLEWWSLNESIITKIKEHKPDLILITGIFSLAPKIFQLCESLNIQIINYLTDYPWNPHHHQKLFLNNFKKYDFIFSTKSIILQELIDFGIKKVDYLPFGYDPFVHHFPQVMNESTKEKFSSDITFIGVGDRERLPHLKALKEIDDISLNVYGPRWNRIFLRGMKVHPSVFEEDYRRAVFCSKICLGIVRKRNRDQSTIRTFEIAACGSCGIYEDTSEHRNILSGYPEYGFFTSPDDLAEKCRWLLKHPVEREMMRQLGIQLIVNESNTYTARLKTILERTLA